MLKPTQREHKGKMTKNKMIFQASGSSIWWQQQTITTGCRECLLHMTYENSYGRRIRPMYTCDKEVCKRQRFA